MDEERLKHSLGVAKKMVSIAQELGLDEEEQKELFILGFNHDIGYEYGDSSDHGEVGGKLLEESEYKYWKEIYYHGKITDEYESLYLDILNTADMLIDGTGKDVGFDGRLKDIEERYGIDSAVYNRCRDLIDSLKEKWSNYDG